LPDHVVLFEMAKRNWYSMVPLINSLDASSISTDIRASRDIVTDLGEAVNNYDRVVCCFSFFTTQRPGMIELVREIRGLGGKADLVAGGPHATGHPRETLEMGFDVVVRGEGEIVFPGVIGALLGQGGQPAGWPIVQGRPLDDLDALPPISMKFGLYPPIEITRGCLFGCGYCSVPGNFGAIRHRSIGSIMKSAGELLDLRGSWDFRFISPNSLGYGSSTRRPNGAAVAELLSSLRELEGRKRIFFATFPSEARPDFVTEDLVEIVKEYADNSSICIGAQSGSDGVLKAINRGHDTDSVRRAVEIVIGAGLKPIVDFILGLPFEDESDQMRSLEFMREIIQMGGRVRAHHFLPLAGSALGGMEPTPINRSVMSEIGRLALEGGATGSFTEQMRMAREIVRWEKLSSSSSNSGH